MAINVKVLDMTGKEVGTMDLNEAVFGAPINKIVLHQAVKAYLANQRQGTQSALTRAEVRGGGAKPWKQKGTGRARQGSIRAPQWIHGGIVFAPKPRSYRILMTKKTKRLAIVSALSAKVADGNLIVLDNISLEDIKTKKIVSMLKALEANKALIMSGDIDHNLVLSARNLQNVSTTTAKLFSVYDILKYEKLILTKDAVAHLEEVYA
ncbi:MAG: 50S ribosomal protein L4 [Bacillota bacterium]|nr:50S ribosomal protein L4 [Bacillota bacterium]